MSGSGCPSPGVRTDWQEIGHGTVSRFQLREFRKEELAVRFGEQAERAYEIVIENADNPPLEITSVEAIGDVYRLVYLAGEGHRYQLRLRVRLRRVSVATTRPRCWPRLGPRYQPVETGLGPRIEGPRLPTDRTRWRNLLNSPAVLTLAIVLMVVVLAWVLFRAGAQIKKLPDAEL